MKRSLILLGALIASTSAWAQENTSSTTSTDDTSTNSTAVSASDLDLSVPNDPIQYRSDSDDTSYKKDPPGTYYGDTSGKPASKAVAAEESTTDRCEGKLHGSVATGFGYSSHGGNANWQAANINSCKTFYDDDGNAHEVGISISVGQGDGFDYGRGRGGPPPHHGW